MARKHGKDRGVFVRTLPSGREVLGARVWINGRERKFTKSKEHPNGFPHKTAVKNWLQKTHAEIREGRFNPDHHTGKGSSVSDLIDEYYATTTHLKSHQENLTFVTAWKDLLGHIPLSHLQTLHIDRARAKLLAKKLTYAEQVITPTRVNRYFSWFKACLRWAIINGIIDKDPTLGLKKYREEEKPFIPLSHIEWKKLNKHLSSESKEVVQLSYLLGLRRGEIFGLRWEQINLEDAYLVLQAKKSRKEKIVPLHPVAVTILQGWTPHRYSPWVFPSPRNPDRHRQAQGWYRDYFKTAVEAAGLHGRIFHHLRHAHIVEMLLAGADARSVQEQLGLSSLALIQRYSKVANTVLRANINRLPAEPEHKPERDRRHRKTKKS